MRPRNKGDFYDKPNSYNFLNLRPARLRPVRARPVRVRPARARPARVRLPSKRPNATRPKTYLRPKSITTLSRFEILVLIYNLDLALTNF